MDLSMKHVVGDTQVLKFVNQANTVEFGCRILQPNSTVLKIK